MKTAVIYARYSCDNQTEQSIEGQLNVCQDYAKRNDILILDTYVDRAMTGTNDNRPAFQKMLKDSAGREWDYILVYKLDRFSRNKYETAIHKKTLRDNGVKVLSAMENIPDTPEGIILESLLEGMNQYYSAELAQKVRRGMRETRRKGFYQGGPILYGYKVVGRKFVIDEMEAETVRFMFDQFSKGIVVREIIERLTAKGILIRGKPFPMNTVYKILRNEKYTGMYKHGDEIVDNMYPQIIPSDLYEKVRAIEKKNKTGGRSIKTVYLLRFKIRCGYCGQLIGAEGGVSTTGNYVRYYKCTGRKRNRNKCSKKPVRKELLEDFVLKAVVDKLSEPETLDEIVREVMKIQNDNSVSSTTLTRLKKEKQGVDKALENLVIAVENGLVARTTNARMHELENRQDELERRILLEQNKQEVKITESDIRSFYEQALRSEPRMLIASLVKEIVLYDDRIEIHYNTPLKKSPDDNQGSPFFTCCGMIHLSDLTGPRLEKTKVRIDMYLG